MLTLIKIWNFIKNPVNQKLILLIIIVILSLLYFKSCDNKSNLKVENFKLEQNQAALLDSLKYVKNKNGELQAEKLSFISSTNDLKKLSKELSDEIVKQEDKVLTLTKINGTLQSKLDKTKDSLHNLKYKPIFNSETGGYTIKWDFNKKFNDENYRILEGYTDVKYDSTTNSILNQGSILSEDMIKFNLVTGFSEDDGQLKIFVKTDYPGLKFDNIQGTLIDPNKSDIIKKLMKPKRWSIGPNFGYGIVITPTGKITTGVVLGISLQYSFIKF
jgi:hypothetical protein